MKDEEKVNDIIESYKYAVVRQNILDALRTELIGPDGECGEESGNPEERYITGKLYSTGKNDSVNSFDDSQQIGAFRQTSCGLHFYLESNVEMIRGELTWIGYDFDKEGEKYKWIKYEFPFDIYGMCLKPGKDKLEIPVNGDVACIHIDYAAPGQVREGYQMISVTLTNIQKASSKIGDVYKTVMYNVQISLYSIDGEAVFVPEYLCRSVPLEDDYLYEKHPVFAKGLGCAAKWETTDGRTDRGQNAVTVCTSFIPDCEINGVSPTIDELKTAEDTYEELRNAGLLLGMRDLAERDKKDSLFILGLLVEEYEAWINSLNKHVYMEEKTFQEGKGREIIENCMDALERMQNGLQILSDDQNAWLAFTFMNEIMYKQRAMAGYANRRKQKGKKKDWELEKFYEEDKTEWRPFQIAFILLNLKGLTDPESEDRDIVDLLYFPTGGGKTEAYLGLLAFTMSYRRLLRLPDDIYERDGGVTAILRYTLRLLAKQQRDRLTLMILSAELVRKERNEKMSLPIYGEVPFSIGFWVGSGVTPNELGFYKRGYRKGQIHDPDWNKIHKQLKRCPCCGKKLKKKNFNFGEVWKSNGTVPMKIICSGKNCKFQDGLPIYLIDSDVYKVRPTVVIATADKFAQLPREGKSRNLFGLRNSWEDKRNYYPPELIIQDELHLISGPLGSIYGGYEALVEEMCSVQSTGKKIGPKYVVFTATIENAEEQIHSLYGRSMFRMFPPEGFESGESFFIKEVSLPTVAYDSFYAYDEKIVNGEKIIAKGIDEEKIRNQVEADMELGEENIPFRQYVGVCGNGISTARVMSRVYAVILQTVKEWRDAEDYKKYTDPYYTLIGFFNTIRELGSTVWQIEDESEIPALINDIAERNLTRPGRKIKNMEEITSRLESEELADVLHELETEFSYDVALATNMIAVGLDIDRLGIMVVRRPPNQNSEYIQVTSRVGRKYPGLIVTVYNPYQERNLSYYENFVGFHSQMYRFVEGTTATPFAEHTWGRILHVIAVGMLRLRNENMSDNDQAGNILDWMQDGVAAEDAETLPDDKIDELLDEIIMRMGKTLAVTSKRTDTILALARKRTENFLNGWIQHTIWMQNHIPYTSLQYIEKEHTDQFILAKCEEVMVDDIKPDGEDEKLIPAPTLNSMRFVEPNLPINLSVQYEEKNK